MENDKDLMADTRRKNALHSINFILNRSSQAYFQVVRFARLGARFTLSHTWNHKTYLNEHISWLIVNANENKG